MPHFVFMIYDGEPPNATVVLEGTLAEGRAYIKRIEALFQAWWTQKDPLPMSAELAMWEGGELVASNETYGILHWNDDPDCWWDMHTDLMLDDDLNVIGHCREGEFCLDGPGEQVVPI